LYAGSAPYHIDKFFKESSKEIAEHCDSKQIKGIADHFMAMYNAKLKKEKAEIRRKAQERSERGRLLDRLKRKSEE
jgi:hypothetical protein